MQYHITEADKGRRLDAWLAERLDPPLARHQVQLEIKRGTVLVQGTPRAASYRLREDDVLEFNRPVEPISDALIPSSVVLSVLFEDEHLLVIDKPAGLVVHPAPGHEQDTMANALLAHCGPSILEIGGPGRCGIVHRLDKLTSGLLIAAKTQEAHEGLASDLAERKIQRRYIGISIGHLKQPEGEIDRPIGRRPNDRKKMGIIADGRPAKTYYRVLLETHGCVLLLIRLHTGRTHQIRVHLQSIGHPILGDDEYGWTKQHVLNAAEPSIRVPLAHNWPDRQMLHAAGLKFEHPVSSETITLRSDPPADMGKIMDLIFGDSYKEVFNDQLFES